MSDNVKSWLAVFAVLAALVYAETDDFTHRCLAGDHEYCVK